MLQKNRIYPVIVIIAMLIVWQYRKGNEPELVAISGQTMGTTYSIKYFEKENTDFQEQIDSLLIEFNHALSTYEPESEISTFNNQTEFYFARPFLFEVLSKSKQVFDATSGAFDPTVYPLVSAWGFGPGEKSMPDAAQVDSLMQLIGFDHIAFTSSAVSKDMQGVMLDFSAIAKGYGVDVVAAFLEEKDISDFFVEIGGEIVTSGANKDKPWRVGIETPAAGMGGEMLAIVELEDMAMATSGNYRNFYVVDGKKYAHTIDPSTGYPVEHSLLSATVFSETCMEADAFATAFMVVGVEESKRLAKENDLEIFLIYSKDDTYETFASEGIADKIENVTD
jgi:thiamine biosynthesis lipoprotein